MFFFDDISSWKFLSINLIMMLELATPNWIRYAPTLCIKSSQTNGLHIQGSCGTIPLSAGEALESRHAALHFVNEANAH